MKSLAAYSLCASCFLVACAQDRGDRSHADGGMQGGEAEGGAGGVGGVDQVSRETRMPVRRLSATELAQTVTSLFELEADPVSLWPRARTPGHFENEANVLAVDEAFVQAHLDAANAVAERAWATRAKWLPCASDEPVEIESCRATFLADVAPRIFRRPLEAAERAAVIATFDAHPGTGFHDALLASLQRLLLSPSFLYLNLPLRAAGEESPDPEGHYALAARLSYVLWQDMPDDRLFAAAAAGRLRGEISAEVDRMMNDPRAQRSFRHFVGQWLELDDLADLQRDPKLFPAYAPALREDLREQVLRFVQEALWADEGDLQSLLTGDRVPVTTRLAPLYPAETFSFESPGEPWSVQKVANQPTAGVLTLPGVLAVHSKPDASSPVERGLFVLAKFLCQDLPMPPQGLDTSLPPAAETATTRQRFEPLNENPACRGCHLPIAGVGFMFEGFDALGRWRTLDNGQPVDARGWLDEPSGPRALTSLDQLGRALAAREDVRECLARHWLRHGLGRWETGDDERLIDRMAQALAGTGAGWRDLVAAALAFVTAEVRP